MAEPLEVDGIKLTQTCNACPEQYEASRDGKRAGYLRLRRGHFTVECPDACRELVYEAEPQGVGVFEPQERQESLGEAVRAIQAWLANHPEHALSDSENSS